MTHEELEKERNKYGYAYVKIDKKYFEDHPEVIEKFKELHEAYRQSKFDLMEYAESLGGTCKFYGTKED